MSLADILIPLAGSISNERAQAMRKACDDLESAAQGTARRLNHALDLISLLTKRVEALELELAVLVEGTVEFTDAPKIRSLAKRVEALERAVNVGAEDNGDLDVRVRALERANENTGAGTTSQTGAVPHSDAHYGNPVNGGGAAAFSPSVKAGTAHQGLPSPASPASVPEWFPSDEECWKAYAQECNATEAFEMCPDGVDAVRRLIASRAPRPAPLSVEDGLRDVAEDVLSWLNECKLDGEDGQLRERLRVALSALPAPSASCDSCEAAWGVIANAHGGRWSEASADWRAAAERWRDAWHETLRPALDAPKPASEAQGEPTIERCEQVFVDAWLDRERKQGMTLTAGEHVGIAAVRDLCLASRAPSPSPALAAQLIDAAARIDWKQVGLNGGGCFHLEEDGRFCLRAHHWVGHGGEKPIHLYEPFYVAMTRIAKAAEASPALAAIVERKDA